MIFQRLDDVGNTDDDGDDDECYNCKSSKCMTAPTPLGSIVCRVRKELFVQTKLERESRNMDTVLLKESESKSLINRLLPLQGPLCEKWRHSHAVGKQRFW